MWGAAAGEGGIASRVLGRRETRVTTDAAGQLKERMPEHALIQNRDKNVGAASTGVGRCRVCHQAGAYAHCHSCSDYGGAEGGIY